MPLTLNVVDQSPIHGNGSPAGAFEWSQTFPQQALAAAI